MRQVLSTALVAVIVGALAGVTASTIAQTPEEAAIAPSAVTVANADKVDGKHAVGYTTKKRARAGKLVATNNGGMLPPNIVSPFWGAIKNTPAGFADGVDDAGVTGLTVTRLASDWISVPAGSAVAGNSPSCPAGSAVVGGGVSGTASNFLALASGPLSDLWVAGMQNQGGSSRSFKIYVICLETTPGQHLTTASKAGRAPARVKTLD